ncbi:MULTISPECIES: ATP synthase subunit I [Leptolyngbya]|jgi:ATP synthase protein I|uniref:ATP synthase protein I n=2 Tax=Leptolyngbya boryana TaxID=1184 RepID=A0A1Z4JN10_LEPBY|nr:MULTISPECIES: ATP synthase subunit I [Leptolyngbya]BAY58023.1 ATP synthase protein I [Leptolyngbya boryana NIES-2135]MBD1856217.1 ATP synthase subunit I [Leptolyngbya sp. FACHB-1624]MBD2367465.1 ATP synthase subunit I [Leptolyngbya sp. FACHB-161]MBD2373989.1 ATP synthase subunit I [Leptolyngbya sp. FACHB-238]MBD2398211.1 ATP synthase subunit I [Leptolyngbya sp. FACHB-239]
MEETIQTGTEKPESSQSMDDFYRLQNELLIVTVILTGLIFFPVWYFYSLNTALNYLIGACTGVVYLKLLARNVERLGTEKQKISKTHLAVFIGVMVLVTQVKDLHVLPVFLGFLTYKGTLLVHTLRILFKPEQTQT